jgi:hypothetical protein
LEERVDSFNAVLNLVSHTVALGSPEREGSIDGDMIGK